MALAENFTDVLECESDTPAGAIAFRENGVLPIDPALGAAVERAVEEALDGAARESNLGMVDVRIGVVHDEWGTLQFLCKVECGGSEGAPPWRWWSSLTQRPQKLKEDLARGLERRRVKLQAEPRPVPALASAGDSEGR